MGKYSEITDYSGSTATEVVAGARTAPFRFPVLGKLQCSPPWVNAAFPVLGESRLRDTSCVGDGLAEVVDAKGPTENG